MKHREGFNPERLSWEAMPLSNNAFSRPDCAKEDRAL